MIREHSRALFRRQRWLAEYVPLIATATILNALIAPSPFGVVLSVIGARDVADGQAQMIDAMNRHNDADACRETKEPTS